MKGNSTMSKKKYYELCAMLDNLIQDKQQIETMLGALRTVLEFDPDVNTYNSQQAEKIKEYRKKKKDEGISTYISSGSKTTYYRQKALKQVSEEVLRG